MGPLSTLAGRSPPAQSLFRPCPRPWHHSLNHPPAAPVPHPLLAPPPAVPPPLPFLPPSGPPASPSPPVCERNPPIRPFPGAAADTASPEPGHPAMILAVIPSVSS